MVKCNPKKIKKNKKVIVTETNEELLAMYKSFSEKIKAYNGASIIQLKKHGFKYSKSVLLRRFGSWKEVKEAAGYTFNLGSLYSKDDVAKLLLNARAIKGRRLSQNELNGDSNLPVLETVLKFFKTTKISAVWDELELGLEKTSTEGKRYSLEEIKDLLYKEYCVKGSPLTVMEISAKTTEGKLPGKTTIYRHFKTQKIREIWG
ncbi:MAG: homing endonuclease associated repeat-containing protein, partial [Fusobacteriaceae bacterium]